MRSHNRKTKPEMYFRKVVKNGSTRALNIGKILPDWKEVRITIVYKDNYSITLVIEDLSRL